MVGLNVALAQTAQYTEANSEKLQKMAEDLQETTAIADDRWLGVIQRLIQFGASADEIEPVTNAVKNLAGIMDVLRWKSPRMPLAYNRNLAAEQGAAGRLMAKLV